MLTILGLVVNMIYSILFYSIGGGNLDDHKNMSFINYEASGYRHNLDI